jgi:hypothetical protein
MVFLMKKVELDFCFLRDQALALERARKLYLTQSFSPLWFSWTIYSLNNLLQPYCEFIHDMLTCCVHLTANASALKVSCELLRIFVTGLHL